MYLTDQKLHQFREDIATTDNPNRIDGIIRYIQSVEPSQAEGLRPEYDFENGLTAEAGWRSSEEANVDTDILGFLMRYNREF